MSRCGTIPGATASPECLTGLRPREIWFWSQYGVFRFFRIEDAGLVELDQDGNVLVTPRPEHIAKKQPVPAGTQSGDVPA